MINQQITKEKIQEGRSNLRAVNCGFKHPFLLQWVSLNYAALFIIFDDKELGVIAGSADIKFIMSVDRKKQEWCMSFPLEQASTLHASAVLCTSL